MRATSRCPRLAARLALFLLASSLCVVASAEEKAPATRDAMNAARPLTTDDGTAPAAFDARAYDDDVIGKREVDDYHYIFSADCKPYMEWQSVAVYYSWVAAGSPGAITRLLGCDDHDAYPYVDSVPTHRAPLYTNVDPNDAYSAYNMPGSILHWCEHNTTDKRWVVKLDADMILRKPLRRVLIPSH